MTILDKQSELRFEKIMNYLTPSWGERVSCTSASRAPISRPTAALLLLLSPWAAKLAKARAAWYIRKCQIKKIVRKWLNLRNKCFKLLDMHGHRTKVKSKVFFFQLERWKVKLTHLIWLLFFSPYWVFFFSFL